MEFHEVANLFPLIEGQEFENLVKDISENGLQQPIWTYQNKIIDGRNRYRACIAAGVEPRYQEWDGKGSLVAFTISLNVKRRHLTSSQLAAIALNVMPLLEKEADERMKSTLKKGNTLPAPEIFPEREKGEAREQAAQMLGTNAHYISDLQTIAEKKDAPELVHHVIEGTLTVSDAKAIADLPKERQSVIIDKVVQRKEEEGKRVSRAVRDALWEEAPLVKELPPSHLMRIMSSSETPEWYTPADIVERTLKLFGEIDLDPCSNSHINPNVPANTHYTKEDDGLNKTWYGKVYMNPPYGTEIPQWTQKLLYEYHQGRIKEAVALVPGRIDTAWFQPLYEYLICNIKGRLQFSAALSGAPFPSVAIYIGERKEAFIEAFKDAGPIVEKVS